MRNYRVTGARRDDGSRVDEILLAESEEDAVSRANALGVLVAEVRIADDVGGPMYTAKRRRRVSRKQRERLLIRFVARVGALVLMAPGALVLVTLMIEEWLFLMERNG